MRRIIHARPCWPHLPRPVLGQRPTTWAYSHPPNGYSPNTRHESTEAGDFHTGHLESRGPNQGILFFDST